MSTITTHTVRNYTAVAVTLIALSLGLTEILHNPFRSATQNTLDSYGNYAKAGMVAHAQSALK